MFYRNVSSRRRAGFTLVEALVVVAILAILFGLTTAAVMRALMSAEDARVSVEIKQLEAAISTCKTHFGIEKLPSQMVLRNNNFYDVSIPVEKRSKEFLAQMFPRMKFATTAGAPKDPNFTSWHFSNTAANASFELDPAETLVFFLGGRQSANGSIDGWSPNPLDPINGAGTRVQPFYEFIPDRVKPHLATGSPRVFRSYMDPYNPSQPQPYVYFTSYRTGDDYSPLDTYAAPAPNGQGNDLVRAFRDPNSTKFINPNSFQIISAGRDGLFGEFQLPANSPFILWRNGNFTSAWTSGTPAQRNAPNDNLANFHPTKLNIPQ